MRVNVMSWINSIVVFFGQQNGVGGITQLIHHPLSYKPKRYAPDLCDLDKKSLRMASFRHNGLIRLWDPEKREKPTYFYSRVSCCQPLFSGCVDQLSFITVILPSSCQYTSFIGHTSSMSFGNGLLHGTLLL